MQHREHYEFKESPKRQFLREQTECPFCRGRLDIETKDINTFIVEEEARCLQCSILSRKEDHTLH